MLVAAAVLTFVLASVPAPTGASAPPVQSTISIFLSCPSGIFFGAPPSSSNCGSGNFTATYTGVNETVGSSQNSVFFMASATGGVKVTFNVTDVTTGEPLIQGVGYGKMPGGDCSSPTPVTPASFTASNNQISTGDKIEASLEIIFTGTGTPVFCSGGGAATVVSFETTVAGGKNLPLLTTTLAPGNPSETTLNGYRGLAETYVNTGGVATTAIVLGVVKSSSGATVQIISSSITLSAGANALAFLPIESLPSGTYTISMIVVTASGVPISTMVTTTAAV